MPRIAKDPAPRACLRLVTGASSVSQRELEGSRPRWLRIGSDPDTDWRVHADGVAPAHCELLWDGQGLFVQDRLRLGGTYVGKQRVTGWMPLVERAVLRLGAAAMWVQAPASGPDTPDPEALRWMQDRVEQVLAERRSASAEARDSAPSLVQTSKKMLLSVWWLCELSWLGD